MATKKTADRARGAGGEEPERAVDPPEATADEVTDDESSHGAAVGASSISQASLTLPSGASYIFNAGNVLQLSAEDAAFVVDEGYGSETDDPSGE